MENLLKCRIGTIIKIDKKLRLLAALIILFSSAKAQIQNNALHFDGANDFVTLDPVIPDIVATATEDFTVEFWMRADLNLNPGVRVNLFAINPAGNAVTENRLALVMGSFGGTTQTGQLTVYEPDDVNQATPRFITSMQVIGDNRCHHIAYVRTGNMQEAFIDGVSIGVMNVESDITATDRASLGQEWDFWNPSDFYNGEIDELRIWNVARTQAQIQADMNAVLSAATPGLIAYYDFNQGIPGGNNAGIINLDDLTVNNNDGTLMNFALNGATSNWIAGGCGQLSISKSVNMVNAYAGQPITYSIDICNNTNIAQTVNVYDQLPVVPSPFNFISSTLNGGPYAFTYNAATNEYNATINIAPGCHTIQITGFYPLIGTYTNCASIVDQNNTVLTDGLGNPLTGCAAVHYIMEGCPMNVYIRAEDCVPGSEIEVCMHIHNIREDITGMSYTLVYPDHIAPQLPAQVTPEPGFPSSVTINATYGTPAFHANIGGINYMEIPVSVTFSSPVTIGSGINQLFCLDFVIVATPPTNTLDIWVENNLTSLTSSTYTYAPALTQATEVIFPDPNHVCWPPSGVSAAFFYQHGNCFDVTFTASEPDGVHKWEFGDGLGTPINGGGPTYTYSYQSPGTYIVTHTVTKDGWGAVETQTITITDPFTLDFSGVKPPCKGMCNGEATVNVTGGTAPYSYEWNAGNTNATATNLCAGTQAVTVMDANGCQVTRTVEIPEYLCPSAGSDKTICKGYCVQIGTPGVCNYNYVWSHTIMPQVGGIGSGTNTNTTTTNTTTGTENPGSLLQGPSTGITIYDGNTPTICVRPATTTTYRLVISTPEGEFVCEDYVTVTVLQPPHQICLVAQGPDNCCLEITGDNGASDRLKLSPNPATDIVIAEYKPEGAQTGRLEIRRTSNQHLMDSYPLDMSATQQSINVSQYPTGMYDVTFIRDGVPVEIEKLSIVR